MASFAGLFLALSWIRSEWCRHEQRPFDPPFRTSISLDFLVCAQLSKRHRRVFLPLFYKYKCLSLTRPRAKKLDSQFAYLRPLVRNVTFLSEAMKDRPDDIMTIFEALTYLQSLPNVQTVQLISLEEQPLSDRDARSLRPIPTCTLVDLTWPGQWVDQAVDLVSTYFYNVEHLTIDIVLNWALALLSPKWRSLDLPRLRAIDLPVGPPAEESKLPSMPGLAKPPAIFFLSFLLGPKCKPSIISIYDASLGDTEVNKHLTEQLEELTLRGPVSTKLSLSNILNIETLRLLDLSEYEGHFAIADLISQLGPGIRTVRFKSYLKPNNDASTKIMPVPRQHTLGKRLKFVEVHLDNVPGKRKLDNLKAYRMVRACLLSLLTVGIQVSAVYLGEEIFG